MRFFGNRQSANISQTTYREENDSRMEDFHSEQLEHYGYKTGRTKEEKEATKKPQVSADNGSSTPKAEWVGGSYAASQVAAARRQGYSNRSRVILSTPHAIHRAGAAAPPASTDKHSIRSAVHRVRTNLSEKVSGPGGLKGSLKEFSDILRMDDRERKDFEFKHAKVFDRALENYRRANPEERPDYQKEYLVGKQKGRRRNSGYDYLQGPRDFPVLLQEYASEKRQDAALEKEWQKKYEQSVLDGQPLLMAREKPDLPSLRMSSLDRVKAQKVKMHEDGEPPLDGDWSKWRGMNIVQKAACGISKALDPIKRRDGSSGSDMSFGMTDQAPKGTMDKCKQCKRPTKTFLKKGLCKRCHEVEQVGKQC